MPPHKSYFDIIPSSDNSLDLGSSDLNWKNIYIGKTKGSVLFMGADGLLSEDNANLYWDDTNNELNVNSINLNDEVSTSIDGIIFKGTSRWIHNYVDPVGGGAIPNGENLFIGLNSGNFTLGSTATQTYHSSLNVGIGDGSLNALTIGFRNIALGRQVLGNCTSGNYNTGIGANTMTQLTTGATNMALGYAALYLTNGSSNTAMGYAALLNDTTSVGNTAIGFNAGRYRGSGTDTRVTGDYGTYIGYQARASANSTSNEMAFGLNAVGGGSNSCAMGNLDNFKLLLGSGNDASIYYDGTDLYINPQEVGSGDLIIPNGNVGIGTATPSDKLEVSAAGNNSVQLSVDSGPGYYAEWYFRDNGTIKWRMRKTNTNEFNLYSDTLGDTVLHAKENGNIGIGTTSPLNQLHLYDATDNVVMRIETDKVGGQAGFRVVNDARSYLFLIDALDRYSLFDDTAADYRWWIDSSGNMALANDNAKIQLGDAQDVSMYYDGTDFNIDTDLVAPSDLVIDCGTNKTIELAETVYEDWQGELVSNQKLNPYAHIVVDSTEASVTFKTSCDTGDYVYMNPQMRHKWKLGTDILPHIHWWQTTSAQPNWLIQYRWQRNGQAKTTTWTDLPMTTNAFTYVSGTLDQITYGAAITPPANYSISDIIQFRIIRDVANGSGAFAGAETGSVDVDAVSFDYHYEIDTMGSRQEYVK